MQMFPEENYLSYISAEKEEKKQRKLERKREQGIKGEREKKIRR